jgi:hypothetical protein
MPLKRSLYDSEYERVRREAGVGARSRPDFLDDDEETRISERVDAKLQDFRERMAELRVAETTAEARRQVDADARRKVWHRRAVIGEYQRAGLTPPIIGGDGMPAVSLSLLLSLGWQVREMLQVTGGTRLELLKPIAPKPVQRRRTREDYAAEAALERDVDLKDTF